MGPFADGEGGAVDVAFDVAVDLDVTVALQIAGDAQIGADDRGNASLSSAALWLRRSRSMRLRGARAVLRSEEHTSELQSLMRISYAAFCLKKTKNYTHVHIINAL